MPIDIEVIYRTRDKLVPSSAEVAIGERVLGSLTGMRLLDDGDDDGPDALVTGTFKPDPATLELWVVEASRHRGLSLNLDDLLPQLKTLRRGDGLSEDEPFALSVVEHVLAWMPVTVALSFEEGSERGPGQVLPARMRKAKHETKFHTEAWEYANGSGPPRRKPPVEVRLEAPEFDYFWSDEYRAILLGAPQGRTYNSVPLLRRWLYAFAFQYLPYANPDIERILREAPGKAPADLKKLDQWYPGAAQRADPEGDLTEWTSWRLLDGFGPFPLQSAGAGYLMDFHWHDVPIKSGYLGWELPWVVVRWAKVKSQWKLSRITVRRRKSKEPVKNPTAKALKDAYELVLDATPASGARVWQHALYLARSSALLAGEVDLHLARAHLLVESAALIVESKLAVLDALKPVRELLAPFLRDVSGINLLGNPLILGNSGVLCKLSGMDGDGLKQRLANQLACCDWKGFAPRPASHPLLRNKHRYGVAANAFWEGIGGLVDSWFQTKVLGSDFGAITRAFAGAITAHSQEKSALSVRTLKPYPGASFVWAAEFVRRYRPTKGHLSVPESIADVKAFCCWVIFHAVCVHGWVNDEGWTDGGSLAHAPFGIRCLSPPKPGQSREKWREKWGPGPTRGAMQLSLAWVLDRVAWGKIGDPLKPSTLETWDKKLFGELEVIKMLVAEMDKTMGKQPSPAERLNSICRPLADWRVRINS